MSLVERAYVIYEGQVLTQGNPAEIIANEDVRRVYLGICSLMGVDYTLGHSDRAGYARVSGMALSTKLELRQGQQLVMTPQLQQAIRLLQLSNMELTQFVETELERNPLLEREEADDSAFRAAGDDAPYEGATRPDAASDRDGGSSDGNGDGPGEEWRREWSGRERQRRRLARPRQVRRRPAAALDTAIDNVYPDTPVGDPDLAERRIRLSNWASVRQSTSDFGDDDSNLEEFVASEISLRDHLEQQLPLALEGAAERLIGRYLIDLVDEAGYLPRRHSLPSPTSSAHRWSWSSACWRHCRRSIRPACSPARWPSVWRCSSRSKIATTR